MTALALVGGIFPLVIATGAGAGARNSLGNTILGGTIASTILSLFIIPIFFSLAARMREACGYPANKTNSDETTEIS